MTRFSTIIATYNRADLIGATLDSALAQDCDGHEVIVVDDGSTDATGDVLARYGDRITVIRQTNKGPGAARNAGIAKATGDYITLLDSDDLWFAWTLATYQRAIEQHNRPAFVASREWAFQGELTPPAREDFRATAYDDYYASWRDGGWVPLCGVAIRRDALERIGGFDESRMNYEESDLWLRLGASKGFVRIESPYCSARREHDGSITRDATRNIDGVMRIITREKAGEYPGGSAREIERLQLITRHARPLSLACDRSSAWQLYRDTFAWHVRLGRWRYLLGFPLRARRGDG